ncbi:MAG: glycoside hydrolase family 95 protein [Bacteroidales bacterium]|nr:glycoside hydrolase family 95 protein [Bacteroidales bacterium]
MIVHAVKKWTLMSFMLFVCAVAMAADKLDNDQRLWYDAPATCWLEALPLGNSRMGAMVFGGTDTEQIQLNEETFWSGGPHNNNSSTSLRYLTEVRSLIFDGKEKEAENIINREFVKGPHGMRYLTLGSLNLQFGHKDVKDYVRDLDLQTATSSTSYIYNNVKYTRKVIASLADGVVLVNIKASKKGALSFTLTQSCQLPTEVKAEGATLVATIKGADQEGIKAALTAQCRTDVKTNGRITAEGNALKIDNATEATLYVSAATNFVNYNDVSGDASAKNEQYLKAAETMPFATLHKRHVTLYKSQYDRVKLSLPSTDNQSLPTVQRLDKFYSSQDMGMVALLFNYGRYLLISSSQKGGQPANLQGVWNDKMNAPWDSKYTININAEMNYWPAEVCNLSETAEPLFSMIRDLSQTGAETARTMYGCRGWMAHHNTDLWRIAGPVDGAFWGMFPNGGGWLSTHLWEHYQYTLDKDFLNEYYPILKGAADFYLDYMVERDGELLVVPSVSPEQGGRGKQSPVCAGCTMDNQIARDVLSQALFAARELDKDADYQQKLTKAIAMLPPMKIGQYGQLQEWREDLDDPHNEHRHISHLYGLYPSSQISPYKTPDLWKAAGVTLKQRGDQATGWSLGWKTNFWARMLDGNHAFTIISNMLRLLPNEGKERQYPDGRTFPNLFDAHPPFQIDGNFGVTAGIVEMLMQSDPITDAKPYIYLLPALPDAWPAGSISGIKARGGYELSISWKEGKLTSAIITAQQDGKLRLRCKDRLSAKGLIETAQHNGVYEYEIAVMAGKRVSVEGAGL